MYVFLRSLPIPAASTASTKKLHDFFRVVDNCNRRYVIDLHYDKTFSYTTFKSELSCKMEYRNLKFKTIQKNGKSRLSKTL